jgi:sec-independent protein translocase protein TatB
MFGLGISEIVVIVIVTLLLVNPKELPGLARKAGTLYSRIMREINGLRKTFTEFEDEVKELSNLESQEKKK